MAKTKTLLLLLLMVATQAFGGNLDDIRQALEHASTSRVQEKVFIHTDNQCYFVGDTLWYKAYVVRADNLTPTDLSRVLYVELLSPDGLLVERQNIVVNPKGYTCGQFVLQDSLYSGYYELRAYTRWMLNFNVGHHRYRRQETWSFYNRQMAADYFRVWDGLYSRVLPIYSKPEEAGDYDARRMYQRPKTRIPKQKKDELIVTFYPEGGHLIEGVENRVAFDVCDQHGEAVNIQGTVGASGQAEQTIKTEYMGRGAFTVTPQGSRLKARFRWRGKDYDFDLPKAEREGVAMQLSDGQLKLQARGLAADKRYALSVLCRGVLYHFQPIDPTAGAAIALPLDSLPTGVCDATVFDDEGQILADRLFFVNHHEQDDALIEPDTPLSPTQTYEPYQRVDIPLQLHGISEPTNFSLSIRDTNTDEPTYNDGNIMTDLLLSSELRGFIARPAHYFEADDDVHRRHLDLLMMVQGWRKYKWQELADTTMRLRYAPEAALSVEGAVYRMLSINEVEPDEVTSWQNGVGLVGRKTPAADEEQSDPFANDTDEGSENPFVNTESMDSNVELSDNTSDVIDFGSLGSANDHLGVNHGNLRREVLVEAEIIIDQQVIGSVQKTQGGRYQFNVPPFYGDAYLNMKAYKEKDSVKMNMQSRKDSKVLDEDAFADFYVKRDLFFPIYAHEYNFYEKHQPDVDIELMIDTLSELSMENDVHQLSGVSVKGRRRGRRAVDWKKPAFVMDAYELYNDVTDRGLSFGKLDMRQFPVQVAKYLYGNMNRYKMFNVDGRLEGQTYYRNYNDIASTGSAAEVEMAGKRLNNRSAQWLYERLKLRRLQDIRVFTDFEPRTEDSTMVTSLHEPDVTVELVPYADDMQQVTYRDRHIIFHGFSYPEEFYQPDYSQRTPTETPADYRRTLYWNPNAMTDEHGRFTATFYNNGKQTRIRLSAAGVSSDGRLLRSK